MSTARANATRLVTKIRWAIEALFGRFKKKFKYFNVPADNKSIVNDQKSFMVAMALMNMFFKPVTSDKNCPDLPSEMLSRMEMQNKLQPILDDDYLNINLTRYFWKSFELSEVEHIFPQLTIGDLQNIACGTYQLKMALGYYSEHVFSHNGIFDVQIFQNPPEQNSRKQLKRLNYPKYEIEIEEPVLIRAKMHSRYSSSKIRTIYVLADTSKTGRDAILAMHCSCDSGSRTVGSCAHTITLIWYLSHAHKYMQPPKRNLIEELFNHKDMTLKSDSDTEIDSDYND